MALTKPAPPAPPGAPGFPDETLIAEMELIHEPALLYLPGGRVTAVNSAATRLSDFKVVGRSMVELIGRSESRRADGSPLLRGDLPYARALRGEVVDQGERIDIVLPDGSVYRAVVISSPVIVDGKVVAALSVWHDFDVYVRRLADGLPKR
jgi:PAS domain-containing protein